MKSLLTLLVAALLLAACNNSNNNKPGGVLGGNNNGNKNVGGGGWSNSDQQKFLNTCLQNALNAGADQQTANTHCNCTLQKIAAKYASYDDANNKMSSQEVNAMEQQCIQERNGGGGGFGNGGGNDGGNGDNNGNN